MIVLGATLLSEQLRGAAAALADRAAGVVGVVTILGMATALAIPHRR